MSTMFPEQDAFADDSRSGLINCGVIAAVVVAIILGLILWAVARIV